ncbi:MAG TPA: DnaJ domain-containing protein [Bacteroidales bacterium]|nr:DnaJ domain-containing protein [Bacteroidales bacterium]
MVITDYYEVLGLAADASIGDIKKAYRKKARLYHPDINPSPDAKDLFIKATEAYELLITYHDKITSDEEAFNKAMEEWRKYRQYRARQQAQMYAQSSYNNFRKTKIYKSTRLPDGTTIIFNFAISILVFIYTIAGFIIRLRNPLPDEERSPYVSFIFLLLLSIILFSVSFIYLKAYIETIKKRRKK